METNCTCNGTGRLINREGRGLVPVRGADPRAITAKMMSEFYVYKVEVGEVCPCPCRQRLGHSRMGR